MHFPGAEGDGDHQSRCRFPSGLSLESRRRVFDGFLANASPSPNLLTACCERSPHEKGSKISVRCLSGNARSPVNNMESYGVRLPWPLVTGCNNLNFRALRGVFQCIPENIFNCPVEQSGISSYAGVAQGYLFRLHQLDIFAPPPDYYSRSILLGVLQVNGFHFEIVHPVSQLCQIQNLLCELIYFFVASLQPI